jgi:hypothetical protein
VIGATGFGATEILPLTLTQRPTMSQMFSIYPQTRIRGAVVVVLKQLFAPHWAEILSSRSQNQCTR